MRVSRNIYLSHAFLLACSPFRLPHSFSLSLSSPLPLSSHREPPPPPHLGPGRTDFHFFDESVTFFEQVALDAQNRRIDELYGYLDTDGSGLITKKELIKVSDLFFIISYD